MKLRIQASLPERSETNAGSLTIPNFLFPSHVKITDADTGEPISTKNLRSIEIRIEARQPITAKLEYFVDSFDIETKGDNGPESEPE